MLRRTLTLVTFAALLLVATACAGDEDGDEDGTAASDAEPVTELALRGVSVPSDYLSGGLVPLSGGEYATTEDGVEVTLSIDTTVIDDFDGDGVDDGALILRSSREGSPDRYDLFLFLAGPDGPRRVGSASLGEDIVIDGIAAGPGGVTVNYREYSEGAPRSEEPDVTSTLALEVGRDGSVSASGVSDASAAAGGASGDDTVPEPVTPDALESATLSTDLVPSGTVTLEDGRYTAPAAPGSATMVDIHLAWTDFGDLDADGVDDAAAIVISDGGGSGAFYDLVLFVAAPDGPREAGRTRVGDRITINGLAVQDGVATVDFLDRPEGAPFSETPSVARSLTLRLEDGGTAVSETVTSVESGAGGSTGSGGAEADACASLHPAARDAAFVFVATPRSGDPLPSGATVEGCSRTFESNVPWHLLDRDGTVLAEGAAMGGGVDGPAPYAFTVTYNVDDARIGHLLVGGEDPSGGEGPPPVLNRIPVVLLP